jgi:hypothetical protein
MKEAVRSWEETSQRKTHKRAPHVGRGFQGHDRGGKKVARSKQ